MQSRNKSGITGVFRVDGYWVASWMKLNGKEQQKRFSISKLGEESAKQAAVDERLKQIKILNDMGAGYTHQHGKQQRKENEN